jgi:hypothetical protein
MRSQAASQLYILFFYFFLLRALLSRRSPQRVSSASPRQTQLTFSLFPSFFSPFSGAAIEALTAAIQLCESAPNSSKAVKRSAECHELLAICFQQVLGLLDLLVG